MFENCEHDGCQLTKQIGYANGYWKTKILLFELIPVAYCNKCHSIYLTQDFAMMLQEITRAIYDLDTKGILLVDISESYKELLSIKDQIYELLLNKTINPTQINGKLIIARDDIRCQLKPKMRPKHNRKNDQNGFIVN